MILLVRNIIMNKSYKLFDVFAWIGWFHYALWDLIWENNVDLVGFSEKDKFAIQTYLYNFTNAKWKSYGDVTKINISTIPDFDILAWWPPCQSFSVAWFGKWFEDERWKLVFKYLEILKIKRPQYFIFENVKWLLFEKHKEWFLRFIKEIKELWYNIDYRLLNSSDYWVRQDRNRVFIVWKHKDYGTFKFSFDNIKKNVNKKPFSDLLEKNVDEKYFYSRKHQDFMTAIIKTKSRFNTREDLKYHQDTDLINARTLTANLSKWYPTNLLINRDVCKYWMFTCAFVDDKNVCKYCECWDTYQETYSPTSWVRKLTPVECERIQWYPDNWTNSGVSETQRYHQIWNSISPPLIKLIYRELLK